MDNYQLTSIFANLKYLCALWTITMRNGNLMQEKKRGIEKKSSENLMLETNNNFFLLDKSLDFLLDSFYYLSLNMKFLIYIYNLT